MMDDNKQERKNGRKRDKCRWPNFGLNENEEKMSGSAGDISSEAGQKLQCSSVTEHLPGLCKGCGYISSTMHTHATTCTHTHPHAHTRMHALTHARMHVRYLGCKLPSASTGVYYYLGSCDS